MQASPEDYRLTAIVMVVSVTVTLLIVGSVSANSVDMADMPAVAWCAVIIFGIQWLAWIPASILQSERFYDLTPTLQDGDLLAKRPKAAQVRP